MEKKEIVLACDHAGLEMKQAIREMLEADGYAVTDVGTYTADSMDYPDLAKPLAKEVLARSIPGIIICGTGIGVSIAANKMHGIRAALCHDEFTAQMCRLLKRPWMMTPRRLFSLEKSGTMGMQMMTSTTSDTRMTQTGFKVIPSARFMP